MGVEVSALQIPMLLEVKAVSLTVCRDMEQPSKERPNPKILSAFPLRWGHLGQDFPPETLISY